MAKPSEGPSEAFYAEYGAAMLQWSNLEVFLALWFRNLAMIPDWDMAFAIFFSARSFSGRADMLSAALEHSPDGPKKQFLQEALLKAIAYNSVRNQLAHGVGPLGDNYDTIVPGHRLRKGGTLKLDGIKAFRQNVKVLRRTLHAYYRDITGEDGGLPLEECLERLRQLPNEACSSELSRKQKGRLRQLLLGKKKQVQ